MDLQEFFSEEQDRYWWKNAVIYHIYPRSFMDANGDGIGDLQGIIQKLPYLAELGVDAVWMGPVFDSPHVDNGYDVRNYRSIDPMFGSDRDMADLIDAAHAHGIKVLLDLVLNHSSDQHAWFQASAASREGEYADYYIWRDPAQDGGPPNSWKAVFGGPAWTWVEARQQYYLHLFSPQQPDLNWEHPALRSELTEIANFWIERGADGFRMDVINFISKAQDFPELEERGVHGVFIDGPRMLEFLQEFRAGLIDQDVVLVGETPGVTAEAARAYTDPENKALDMVLTFEHLEVDQIPGSKWEPRSWQPADLMKVLADWQTLTAEPRWHALYMSNHDQPRVVSRYGNDGTYRYESASALAVLWYLQRGTPIVYQGDEIGMRNFPIQGYNDLSDLESRNAWESMEDEGLPREEILRRIRRVARDNGRTPMQWTGEKHAGFTEADAPWYPLNPDSSEWNAESQAQSENGRSLLQFYQQLLILLKDEVFRSGDFTLLGGGSTWTAYQRRSAGETAIVVVNLSDECLEPEIFSSALPTAPENCELLLCNYMEGSSSVEAGTGAAFGAASGELRPYEARVLYYRSGS
ncbi:alpha-glucosidase [Spirochaeta dissipatitropha]